MEKIFLRWLRARGRLLAACGLILVIFAAVFLLYDVPGEAVGYAAALSVAAAAVICAADIIKFSSLHRRLRRLEGEIAVSLENLPEPGSLTDEDYQRLLRELFARKEQAAAKADGAARDMTDYYTLWAHQIKTPISAMHLLLQRRGGDPELSAELFKIERYVQLVLSYLRLEGGSDFVFRRAELDGLIRQSVKKYSRIFILQKISLDFQETGLSLLTDEKWFQLAFEQLISNALKYTRPGGRVSVFAKDGGLFVRDTGIGIAPEDLPRIFEKGYTGYNGRQDQKATGIGLYLCRQTLRRLGMDVSAASAVGEGSSFRIDLGGQETA